MTAIKYAALVGIAVFGLVAGCDRDDLAPKERTTDVEVKDKLLGGKEIEKTTVTEQGDRREVKKTETDIDDDGEVKKQETTITGDKID